MAVRFETSRGPNHAKILYKKGAPLLLRRVVEFRYT